MRIALLTILILISTANVFSQYLDIDPLNRINKDSIRIVNAIPDSIWGVKVIPNDAFTGKYDLLILGYESEDNNFLKTNKIEIFWTSRYIDGRYELVITPRQIYLRSSHENPNPNFLFWFINISEKQFLSIKNQLDKSSGELIENCTSEYSDCLSYVFSKAKNEKPKQNDWTNKQYANFKILMNFIKKPMEENGERVNIPTRDEFDKIKVLRLY